LVSRGASSFGLGNEGHKDSSREFKQDLPCLASPETIALLFYLSGFLKTYITAQKLSQAFDFFLRVDTDQFQASSAAVLKSFVDFKLLAIILIAVNNKNNLKVNKLTSSTIAMYSFLLQLK